MEFASPRTRANFTSCSKRNADELVLVGDRGALDGRLPVVAQVNHVVQRLRGGNRARVSSGLERRPLLLRCRGCLALPERDLLRYFDESSRSITSPADYPGLQPWRRNRKSGIRKDAPSPAPSLSIFEA